MSNKRYSTIVTETEERERAAAELSVSTLALAKERAAQAEHDLEEAEDHLAELRGSFARLSEEHTALELATAQAEVERRGLMVRGSTSDRERAQRNLRSTDTLAAEIVADFLRPSFTGVEVVPTFALPSDKPRPSDLPVLVVHQSQAATRHLDGTIQGEVELVYYRGAIHNELSKSDVEDAARAAGVRIQPGLRVRTGSAIDRLELRVRAAQHNAAPVIPTIAPTALGGLAGHLTGRVVVSTRFWDEQVESKPQSGLMSTGAVMGMPLETKVVEHVAQGTERRLTLEATIGVWEKSTVSHPPLADRIASVLEQTPGTFLPGLGVVETLERMPTEAGDAEAAAAEIRKAEGTLHDSTTIGYESAFVKVVKVRAVLVSSVATGSVSAA